MTRPFLFALTLWLATTLYSPAAEKPIIKYPSPNGRFALRIGASEPDTNQRTIELIEKASGKPVVNLGSAMGSHLADTVLVWSSDSRWAAWATRDNREGQTSVMYWNGADFDDATMPEDLPGPDTKIPDDGEGVKNYGGGVKPLRWLKPGTLELASDEMMLAHGNGQSYTGIVRFTVEFDAKHVGAVRKIGKTRTKVD